MQNQTENKKALACIFGDCINLQTGESEYCKFHEERIDNPTKACKCGSTSFYAVEHTIYHSADLVENPEGGMMLELREQEPDGIHKVVCNECNEELVEDNYEINY